MEFDFEIKKAPKKNNELNIFDFLDYNEEMVCEFCNSEVKIKKKFIKCPNYLIIVINKNKNFEFKINEEINVSNFITNNSDKKNSHYELVSMILNYKTIICKTLNKSEKKWVKYGENNLEYNKTFNLEKKLKENPCLLIYQNKII